MSLLSYNEALSIILEHAKPLNTVEVLLSDAFRCIAAKDLTASFDLPRFNNSMMDGYALRFEAALHADPNHPVTLPVIATIGAGDELPDTSPNDINFAYAIMTGAAIPDNCNTVVAIENTRLINHQIELTQALHEHENIRFAGADFSSNQIIIQHGESIHSGHIAVLASFGYTHIPVYRKPTVGLISTGKEIVSDFSIPLKSSQIYNSNTPYLAAQLAISGIHSTCMAHIPDDAEQFKDALAHAKDDIIISTGAVSMGQWDFIPKTLQELGANIMFHKVAQKPGKPILFAVLNDGRYFIGLPGNPASCAVGLRFFVAPLIRALQNQESESELHLPLISAYSKKGAFRHFLKARINWQNHQVEILNGQESFKISPLLHTNAWVVLTENQQEVAEQTLVQVVPIDF